MPPDDERIGYSVSYSFTLAELRRAITGGDDRTLTAEEIRTLFPRGALAGPSPDGVRELAVRRKRRAFRVIRGGRTEG